jgi:hypothetical protein
VGGGTGQYGYGRKGRGHTPRCITQSACKGPSARHHLYPQAGIDVSYPPECCLRRSRPMQGLCCRDRTTEMFVCGRRTRRRSLASSRRESARRLSTARALKTGGRWTKRLGKCRGASLLLFGSYMKLIREKESAHSEAGVQSVAAQTNDVGGAAGQGRAETETHAGGREQASSREKEGCTGGADLKIFRCFTPLCTASRFVALVRLRGVHGGY